MATLELFLKSWKSNRENLIIEMEAVQFLPLMEEIISSFHDALSISVLIQHSNWQLEMSLMNKTGRAMNHYENVLSF